MARTSNRFSPSQLGDFEACPRAYWIGRNHGVAWPRGIFPSLPGGIDGIMKAHYDRARAEGELPSELIGEVPGKLYPDQAKIDRWRNWRTGLEAEVKMDDGQTVVLSGAFDDLLLDGETHIVFDAKTKGSAPKPGDTERYYGRQANCYAHMLNANGMRTGAEAIFAYYYPEAVEASGGAFRFVCEPVKIVVNPEDAVELVKAAYACLAGPIPAPCSRGCEKCDYLARRIAVGQKLKAAKTT